jgi:pimeloyl-ACP methyl ester carboxylesterase
MGGSPIVCLIGRFQYRDMDLLRVAYRTFTPRRGGPGGRATVAFTLVLVLTLAGSASAGPARMRARCSGLRVPVSLSAGLREEHHVAATLCVPQGSPATTVQILVHGATSSRWYWDLPYRPKLYSYARVVAASGIATLAIDRIGACCDSSTPLSPLVTLDVDTWVLHSLDHKLRAGMIGNVAFDKVVTVSHSGGTPVIVQEALTYHDVDGLIISGALHHIDAPTVAKFAAYFEPAFLDAKFARAGLDPLYTTSRPEMRSMFMHAPDVDPQVVATDESLKSTTTMAQHYALAQFLGAPPAVKTEGIDLPVLVAVGGGDVLMCTSNATDCSTADTVRAAEAPYYPNATLQTFVLPGAGHMINLASNATLWQRAAISWTLAAI